MLFDIIIVHGARVAHGVRSNFPRTLHTLLRQLTSDLILRLSQATEASLDDIRALLVIASYSTSGAVFVDIALHAANTIGVNRSLESLLGAALDGSLASFQDGFTQRLASTDHAYQGQLTAARVYYYL